MPRPLVCVALMISVALQKWEDLGLRMECTQFSACGGSFPDQINGMLTIINSGRMRKTTEEIA